MGSSLLACCAVAMLLCFLGWRVAGGGLCDMLEEAFVMCCHVGDADAVERRFCGGNEVMRRGCEGVA